MIERVSRTPNFSRELLLLAAGWMTIAAPTAQSQSVPQWQTDAGGKMAFEVASIKATHYDGGPLRVTGRFDPDGINFSQVTLRFCIQRAYGVKTNEVSGPDWIVP